MNRDRAEAYADHSALLEEIDRLRAELAEYRAESNHTWTVIRAGRDVAEAAIARVRAHCEEAVDRVGMTREALDPLDVLRALDGAE